MSMSRQVRKKCFRKKIIRYTLPFKKLPAAGDLQNIPLEKCIDSAIYSRMTTTGHFNLTGMR